VEEDGMGRLLDQAIGYAKGLGYRKLFIMSGEQGLYEKYGFEKIGDYKTIYGTTDQLFAKEI
jgi:N-acetylglutamate synthase-like GNAT family acetyltransferase